MRNLYLGTGCYHGYLPQSQVKTRSAQKEGSSNICIVLAVCSLMQSLFVPRRKLRKKRPNRILLSLCSSLLCLYITFVVATAIDSERGVAELGVLPCCVLAAFLHYFTLTSLCWMGVEGYNLYLLFVKVVNAYVPKLMLKASLLAWGE